MDRIPFTSYDFWAYLSSGFLFLAVADEVVGTQLLERASWTVMQGAVAVSAAYAVGHLVASLSSTILERGLVANVLGHPRQVLFGKSKTWRGIKLLLPGYFEQLPVATQARLAALAEVAGVPDASQALYWQAFGYARTNPTVMNRLDNFLNMYGFCRNTALVGLICALLLFTSYKWGRGDVKHAYASIVALMFGLGMVLRYLKFYRHYALEVFTSFAHKSE